MTDRTTRARREAIRAEYAAEEAEAAEAEAVEAEQAVFQYGSRRTWSRR